MEVYVGLIVITAIYGCLIFFDTFFKTCAHYPYLRFLDGTGLEIKLLQVRWTTNAFNRFFSRLGYNQSKFLDVWFTIGLYASLALLPVSTYLLLYSFLQSYFAVEEASTITIEPMLPGINLPVSELGYYSLTLVICSIVHEMGHALAAVRENVSLECVGVNAIFILPVAFVLLGTEKLFSLKNKNILKILCAGVWHNIVLSLLAFLIYSFLPHVFSSLYTINEGVIVVNVAKNSPLLGARGLKMGDTIVGINDCLIYNEESWVNCIKHINTRKSGFCLNGDLIRSLDESIPLKHTDNGYLDCCNADKQNNFCFEYLDEGILKLPSHVCLPGRTVVEKATTFCSFEPHACPNNLFCFRPLVENYTNLFKIVKSDNTNVIYSGPVTDVYRTLEVSPYIHPNISSTIPDRTMKLLRYVIVVSMGLGVINIIPCWFMDGQYIISILGNIMLVKMLGKKKTNLIVLTLTTFITFILVTHCMQAVWNALF
ncbi:unnamed protein product [Brassicogethes aeneus]|uniref:Membrane-bound transcription factor site-2 protease n=1 Tax=Brassicogethes aeneus TaxID=1431903 RepID=A0A9P0B2K4_BRAAE|nr:unnamed protein product [Brassicogethes aeneus]